MMHVLLIIKTNNKKAVCTRLIYYYYLKIVIQNQMSEIEALCFYIAVYCY